MNWGTEWSEWSAGCSHSLPHPSTPAFPLRTPEMRFCDFFMEPKERRDEATSTWRTSSAWASGDRGDWKFEFIPRRAIPSPRPSSPGTRPTGPAVPASSGVWACEDDHLSLVVMARMVRGVGGRRGRGEDAESFAHNRLRPSVPPRERAPPNPARTRGPSLREPRGRRSSLRRTVRGRQARGQNRIRSRPGGRARTDRNPRAHGTAPARAAPPARPWRAAPWTPGAGRP